MTDDEIRDLLAESYQPMDPERKKVLVKEVLARLDEHEARRASRPRPITVVAFAVAAMALATVAWLYLSRSQSVWGEGEAPPELPDRAGQEK